MTWQNLIDELTARELVRAIHEPIDRIELQHDRADATDEHKYPLPRFIDLRSDGTVTALDPCAGRSQIFPIDPDDIAGSTDQILLFFEVPT